MLTTEYIIDEIFGYFGANHIEIREITRDEIKKFVLTRAFRKIAPYSGDLYKDYMFHFEEPDNRYTAIIRYKDGNEFKKVTLKVDANTLLKYKKINIVKETTGQYRISLDDSDFLYNTLEVSDFQDFFDNHTTYEDMTVISVTSKKATLNYIQEGEFFAPDIITLPNDVSYIREVKMVQTSTWTQDIIYRSAFNQLLDAIRSGMTGGSGMGITNWQLNLMSLEEVRENFDQYDNGYEMYQHPDMGSRAIKVYPIPKKDEFLYIRYVPKVIDPKQIPSHLEDWFIRYCITLTKEHIGRVRSKFSNLPGPAGGVQLDGTQLLAEAKEDMTILDQELMDLDPLYIIRIM